MQKLYSFLSILILAWLLAGCSASANASSKEIKSAENSDTPANLSEESNPSESLKLETIPQEPPSECPLTIPQDPSFVPPAPYSRLGFEGEFWHGSEHLWTALPADGVWRGLPSNRDGYTQKIFWWSELFSFGDEPQPALVVFGERLDAQAPPLKVSRATNASAGDIGTAMLVGVDFPTAGCWKVTGQYKKSELSFVIWAAP